jgi:hypothetical protein
MIGLGYANTLISCINKIMSLDFHYLQASRFFEYGTYTLFIDENKKMSPLRREVSLFDALCHPPSQSIRDLHSKNYASAESYFGASLERSLDPTLKSPFRDMIIDQWAETYDIVNRLNVGPKSAHFAMQPPGSFWKKHIHSTDCKQTLTFCYGFTEQAIEADNPSRFVVDNGVEHEFVYPSNRFYFTFRDNLAHRSISNEWRFFWIYDFDQHVEVPESDFIEMPIRFD